MRPALPLRSAFALASLLVIGCKGNVSVDPSDCTDPKPEVPPGAWCPPAWECIDGEWVDTAGACPEPLCPESIPGSGTACQLLGQTCTYQEDIPCGPTGQATATCTEAGWDVMSHYCQPEPECPDEMPVVGADCSGWDYAYYCQYPVDTPCGAMMAFLSCDSGLEDPVWKLDGGPSCGQCDGYGAEAACGADPACQWLTPGCGDPMIEAGCYPKEGCDVTGCAEGQTCEERVYNPCHNKLCDGCGAFYFACIDP